MPAILLATLNAKYPHASFGCRYLLANMGELAASTELREFTIQQSPLEIVDEIVRADPRIVGFGVYIWNVTETERVIADLRRVRPEIVVVLGGPEVSYETDQQSIADLADFVIAGEADVAFRQLCERLLDGRESVPVDRPRVITAELPLLTELASPYPFYTNDDVAHRVIYVEASRGCPYECEFCLSALDIPVRQFPLDRLLESFERLLDRGALSFKFVDRTFNLNLKASAAILRFFLDRLRPGLFLHFEMIPDRLPEGLRELIVQFPPGALQFEVGIQTFNPDVAAIISRRQRYDLVEQNLAWLRQNTGVHLHTDLIFGLPGETLESFAAGFDRLVALDPHEIQIGILKRLRGTPIIRHDVEWGMLYSPHPPYEVLQTRLVDCVAMQAMRRFAKTWDALANSGRFRETLAFLTGRPSAFAGVMEISEFVDEQLGRQHAISWNGWIELLFEFLTSRWSADPQAVASALTSDLVRLGRTDRPKCLRPYLHVETSSAARGSSTSTLPKRQSRHQA